MEAGGMQCHGCGSTNVTFDPQRRILICNQCGKQEYYSRATLNASNKVVFARQNAIRFFTSGKYDSARDYAQDVLNISADNAAAVYIMAFHDEFCLSRNGSLNRFFRTIDNTPLEYQEILDLMDLFLAAPNKLIDYQEEVIQVIAKNLQSGADRKMLGDFFDKICPYFISRWPSMGNLNENLIDMYAELTEYCGIPKTCFALLNAIRKNPDSPYASNSFFLKSKSEYFYERFVLPVGKILNSMKDAQLKAKFLAAYRQQKQQYEKDAGL